MDAVKIHKVEVIPSQPLLSGDNVRPLEVPMGDPPLMHSPKKEGELPNQASLLLKQRIGWGELIEGIGNPLPRKGFGHHIALHEEAKAAPLQVGNGKGGGDPPHPETIGCDPDPSGPRGATQVFQGVSEPLIVVPLHVERPLGKGEESNGGGPGILYEADPRLREKPLR
jgi:hypothetical protein